MEVEPPNANELQRLFDFGYFESKSDDNLFDYVCGLILDANEKLAIFDAVNYGMIGKVRITLDDLAKR